MSYLVGNVDKGIRKTTGDLILHIINRCINKYENISLTMNIT